MPHKLLLADDSVTIQRVIELTFADEDVQVQAVGDGMKAIASIQADRPDIVLADIGMPERDGYEVAAFIKGDPQLAHIPVLLLTGAFEPVDETRARAVGCDGVLVKPFEPQMVINRVKDLLAGRRAAGSWAPPSAAAPFGGRPANDAPPAAPGSLEDYFDRLDAAFANLEGAPPAKGEAPVQAGSPPAPPPGTAAPPASAPTDDLGGWDPDLSAKPATPDPTASPSADVAPPPPAAAPPAAQPASPATMPSLADAFAMLLSAEQSRPIAPSAVGGPVPIGEDVIEEVVRRVIARMGDTVLDAAERLVREEIERIKRG
jgi:CheY-like chemotaxis protein